MTDKDRIVVVGAGPVGVVAALAAARKGFPVTVLEAAEEVDDSPRASTFHPSTLEMINELGIMDEFLSVGLVARYFDFWDKPRHTLVARLDHEVLREETAFPFVVQTEQHKLARMGLRRLAGLPHVLVRRGCAFTHAEQRADGVVAHATGPEGPERFAGRWLLGCDGGRSAVRKSLGIDFEGYTFPERFLVLTTLFDFAGAMKCSERSYFADPDEWTNLFKAAGDDMAGRWRAVFPTRVGESDEEALGDAASARRLAGIWPEAGLGDLVHRRIYRVHQRVAARFRVGNVFLAGDAAHVNNPIGGLGLNCGIHDVMELVATLEAVRDGAGDDLLDRYERRRRELNIRFVQRQTVDNKRRLEEKDPAVRRQRLAELRAVAEDEERMRAFLRRTSLLDSVRDAHAIA
ncbi:FAD-dependent oxidoreductase [Streptomyces hoynatensis]|uniref:FAD-dependent oxidoreductase n=1 Tax=Streptomyces hoynatensis TaxID=1141874 RepID=A0A3A9YPL2_9ACTN|nr:FAD-dependent monooxygenase [Streptomyces hoynatensis]RKN37097.1 FAD-dependent oxidoreductase [Streptomyces hoynatensis]